jgi:hypothetical protein
MAMLTSGDRRRGLSAGSGYIVSQSSLINYNDMMFLSGGIDQHA